MISFESAKLLNSNIITDLFFYKRNNKARLIHLKQKILMSPHGALRAYTVLLTAEPRRGSTLVSPSLVAIID